MKSKFTFLSTTLFAILFPSITLAAYNDVVLNTSGTVISIASVSLTIQGGNGANLEQLQVDSDTFTPTMQPSSYIKVSSSDRRKFTITPVGSLKITQTCTDTESTLELDNPADGVSVSPSVGVSTTACAAGGGGGGGGSGGSGGGSSGGGGGGGVSIQPATALAQATPTAPAVAQPSSVALMVSPVFNSNFYPGSRGDDVKRLQQLLNSDSETKVAESGIGSPGNETNYFGPATKNALGKFQLKYGIVQSQNGVGYGNLGPKTRTKLLEVFSNAAPSVSPSMAPASTIPQSSSVVVSSIFNSDLQKGMRNDDIRRLQELLAKDSSIYSDGSATGFYGSLTEEAVRKFQAKYDLPQVGRVGPATRAKLQEVFGQPSAPIVPVPVVNPIQPVVPPASTKVAPPPAPESVPFWMQLQSAPNAGGASVVDPTSPSSQATLEEKKAYAETLPFWMQLTQ